MTNGVKYGPDGLRSDVNGHDWVSSDARQAVGYSGAPM